MIRLLVILLGWATVSSGKAEIRDGKGFEFFEKHIRPVLVDRCYKCHSAQAKKLKGGLRLDTREGLRKGGASGDAIQPGNAAESLLIQALRHAADAPGMPPDAPLTGNVVNAFVAWVNMGAPDPRTGAEAVPAEAGQHWSLRPVTRPELPMVKRKNWPRDRIDHFILARMEAQNLVPVDSADDRTLLRRLHLDLIGLPPTPKETATFLKAAARDRPAAIEQVVDRLLASPQFGPRWGRHWLDVARYAESSGLSRNMLYPMAWRYRNYVIRAFNTDKPYDQFVREQIAGDLLPHDSPAQRDEQTMGTAFLTIGPKTLNEGGIEQFNYNVADDQIDATTRAFLGLTAACARCHDHKYDPISTRDYYALAGIFLSSVNHAGVATNVRDEHVGTYPLGPNGAKLVAERQAKQKEWEVRQKVYLGVIKKRDSLRKKITEAPEAEKTKLERELKPVLAKVSALNREVSALRQSIPDPPPGAMAMHDSNATANSPVLLRGSIRDKGDVVPRGALSAVPVSLRKIGRAESGRLQLAEWITDRRNPLTARVMVNRVWLHLFGRGLVPTPDNFGALGQRPTHPQLLDDLALRFMGHDWSVKRLIRAIVLSRTYQLASTLHPSQHTRDPGAQWYWRATPRRLDAEALRDSILFISGTLDPSVLEGSQVETISKQQSNPLQREIGRREYYLKDVNYDIPHRSIYLPVARGAMPDALSLFGLPDPNLVSGKRRVTTVPAQGMFLLNSKLTRDQSAAAAKRLLEVQGLDTDRRIRLAFEWTINRPPHPRESAKLRTFIGQFDSAKAAWDEIFHALFLTGEFRTVY